MCVHVHVCIRVCVAELGKVEDEIFKTRRNKDQEFRRRNREKKRRNSVSGRGGSECEWVWVL